MTDLKQLNKAIVDGDAKKAVEVTKAALAEGAKPLDLIQNNMIPAMDEVGKLFEEEEYFVPELLLSGRAMRGAFDVLRPLHEGPGHSADGSSRYRNGPGRPARYRQEPGWQPCWKAADSKLRIWAPM